jgi:hypothetical protein
MVIGVVSPHHDVVRAGRETAEPNVISEHLCNILAKLVLGFWISVSPLEEDANSMGCGVLGSEVGDFAF